MQRLVVPRGWQLVYVVGAALFALSVAVQHNDPDPVPWMLLYAAAGAVCIAAVVGVRVVVAAVVVAAVALLWSLSLAPRAVGFLRSDHEAVSFTMKTGDELEEAARECGGLGLAGAWCAVVAVSQRRQRARSVG